MQVRPLLIHTLIDHAARNHGDREIVSCTGETERFRYDYATARKRSLKLLAVLGELGVKPGARIGTLAWNTHRHLELYYGITGLGAICHTINPRLFLDQISFICNHAEDDVIFFDLSFIDLIEQLAPLVPTVRHWVALCDPDDIPEISGVGEVLCYEGLLAGAQEAEAWPQFDENMASALCYTSGTTGDPKGVLFSHRSIVLHSYAATLPDSFGLSQRDAILPGSSMYHVNAWGIPYAATMVGAKLVLPGAKLDGKSLAQLIDEEEITVAFGVPTIWLGYAQELQRSNTSPSSLQRLVIGGAACPTALITEFREKHDVDTVQIWGMTETSPLGTTSVPKKVHDDLSEEERDAIKATQGRSPYGIEMEIVDEDGAQVVHDGKAFGALMVRGHWVTSGYFGLAQAVIDEDGWFETGDISTIDPDGFMQVTDRAKDVIKSGGEWISSIELENLAVGHPSVVEAAVVGVPHPKWDERPLLFLVLDKDTSLAKEEVLEFMSGKIAKWMLPDDVIFLDQIPHTATGKILKTELRASYVNHLQPA
jgi:fatty-acyl-CoA synthase